MAAVRVPHIKVNTEEGLLMPHEPEAGEKPGKEPDGGSDATPSRLPEDPSMWPAETVEALEQNALDAGGDPAQPHDKMWAGEDVLPPSRLDEEAEGLPGESGTEPSEPPG